MPASGCVTVEVMQPIDSKLLHKDKHLLEHTKVPVVTVAASFRHDLAEFYHLRYMDNAPEVLFSRAHYSMAVAALVQAWGGKYQPDPKKAWAVDPTNYVTKNDWSKVEFTENMGKLVARYDILKLIKNLVDTGARNKLPITDAITTPLLYLFEHVDRPILSFHYEAGNILGGLGKKVVQVVTDPHVRDQYLDHAELHTMRFCVFDDNTKVSFLEKAATIGKKVDPRRIVVTGPPVDPRIVAAGSKKTISNLKNRPLRVVIATGGLGTNKPEIEECVRSLAPILRLPNSPLHVIIYVGVHEDIRESIHSICNQEGVPTARIGETDAPVRILYSPHIVEANEALIQYGFPWADGFITKPSGDMAYDAAAAGCFVLTLQPWGEWEENVRDVFEQREISRRAIPEKLEEQMKALIAEMNGKSWVESAMKQAQTLPNLFTHGIQNILKQLPA